MKKNDVFDCVCSGYGADGEGICRVGDMVVFVPGALVGEKLNIKIVKVASSYAYGRIEEILSPSGERVESVCGAFKRCGGCDLLHMSYDEQMRFKSERMKDCIERIGKVETKILPIIGAESVTGYRNKVQLPVGISGGKTVCGYYAGRTHEIVENGGCFTGSEISEKVKEAVLDWMEEYSISAYDETSGSGTVRHIIVRTSEITGQSMAVIVINKKNLPEKDALCEKLKALEITTALYNINTKKTNVITGDKTVILYGSGEIEDELCGLKFMISPLCFYQINRAQAQRLYEAALSGAEITREDTVFDLYCGIGTISLAAAKYAGQVVGVEINEESVLQARKNAKINGLSNTEFYCGDAGKVTAELYRQGKKADVIIVDPPRKGCSEDLLELIIKLSPKRVVYVSCNPATLARDLKFLEGNGYKTKNARAVDMFPGTCHVETVVLLQRQNT
ncbi:MAG: 23S rRNA (uracil(1939)-C(5))-methyltransferase RlmD [Clostridia bacterium]|nr:23S rRNA (uracil(1939)-C(5))-methyltransferase RlmD [Clostridia bacterium]